MNNPHSFWKIAGTISLAALPIFVSGCRTTSGSSGGWGMPGFTMWNPWKANSDLASAKPSNQVPTPPASMLAGAGAARATPPAFGNPTTPTSYAANPAGQAARPANPYGANPAGMNEYNTRQASATQNENGYHTGPYATGGSTPPPGMQPNMNNPANPANPYGNGSATADRRSDVSYGAGGNGGAGGSPATTPSYGTYPNGQTPNGGYPNSSQGYAVPPNNGGSRVNSPYTGASGSATAPATSPPATPPATASTAPPTPSWNSNGRNSWGNAPAGESNSLRSAPATMNTPSSTLSAAPNALPTENGYRPGSTGRAMPAASEVQKASYDNGNVNNAPAGESYNSTYPSTGAAGPSTDAPLYR